MWERYEPFTVDEILRRRKLGVGHSLLRGLDQRRWRVWLRGWRLALWRLHPKAKGLHTQLCTHGGEARHLSGALRPTSDPDPRQFERPETLFGRLRHSHQGVRELDDALAQSCSLNTTGYPQIGWVTHVDNSWHTNSGEPLNSITIVLEKLKPN
jgi:hypothetical protein